ncbi:hypothetical protein HYFRA_00001743 [Hymenoscyphus fraxineus]|uniref:SNF2 N-terminal domain-containing protein n=1 Tax=Hymenoscyphus fraxineus TaxID=746836 RepID=A0A9N9L8V3_9HELO|nr:hypothetical protein HYFRA_00001743 [Hymenoscyphus fraxineus]
MQALELDEEPSTPTKKRRRPTTTKVKVTASGTVVRYSQKLTHAKRRSIDTPGAGGLGVGDQITPLPLDAEVESSEEPETGDDEFDDEEGTDQPTLLRISNDADVYEDVAEKALDDWLNLKQTMNKDNPFDIETRFGRYAMGGAVSRAWSDPITLKRLAEPKQPVQGPNPVHQGAEIAIMEEGNYVAEPGVGNDELDNFLHASSLKLTIPTQNEIEKYEQLETIRDNKAYQPQHYYQICEAWDMNAAAPRFINMPRTKRFHPWQVTAMYRINDDKNRHKGVILADGTGVGKTHTVIGSWMKESGDKQRAYAQYKKASAT